MSEIDDTYAQDWAKGHAAAWKAFTGGEQIKNWDAWVSGMNANRVNHGWSYGFLAGYIAGAREQWDQVQEEAGWLAGTPGGARRRKGAPSRST